MVAYTKPEPFDCRHCTPRLSLVEFAPIAGGWVPEVRSLGEIAAGRLSPVDAYLMGRLRFRGDLRYAKRVYARTADKGNREI